ncbi:MAG TPA: hypothetical protein VLV28_03765, partial [Gaiellaceae bacterium]|nr:hypothetical protein [Gaiellaceae bacterium]
VWSQAVARVRADANPWESRSIEWQLPTPVPPGNFEQTPVFAGDPYGYGTGEPIGVPPAAAPAVGGAG